LPEAQAEHAVSKGAVREAAMILYGLIAAGISVAIITVVAGLGSKLNATFTSVQTAPAK
jgi:pilus assembly protein Flp/PilA